MESANLHHQHQLPDQLAAGSTSSLATPCPSQSFYGFGSNNHLWTSTTTFSTIGNSNPNYNGVVSNLRDSRHKSDNNLVSHPLNSSTTSSMVQDLGFHWNSNASGSFYNQSAHDLQKIKEEQSFPKFTEMLNTSPSHNMDGDYYLLPTSHHVKNEHKGLNELSEKLLLKTLSSSCQINGHQISTGEFLSDTTLRGTSHVQGMPGRGQFSQIYPSINISNLNQSSLSSAAAVSSSLDMSLRALDHLATTTATFSGSLIQPLNDIGISSFGLDHQMQQSHRLSSCAHRRIPSFNNEVTEAKRPGNLMEPKASQAHASKKTRLESRTSCPPFKVRKEKLGDRIAALQQLVAPFGKTDTASVLMEAIGYIKFLQNQVETLSVPYMKSSSTKSYKTIQGAGMKVDDGNDEPKRDLRSRGLCLVPLTCMSYVTGEGSGGSVWPPPNFGGET